MNAKYRDNLRGSLEVFHRAPLDAVESACTATSCLRTLGFSDPLPAPRAGELLFDGWSTRFRA
jgi:hypothetical protein